MAGYLHEKAIFMTALISTVSAAVTGLAAETATMTVASGATLLEQSLASQRKIRGSSKLWLYLVPCEFTSIKYNNL